MKYMYIHNKQELSMIVISIPPILAVSQEIRINIRILKQRDLTLEPIDWASQKVFDAILHVIGIMCSKFHSDVWIDWIFYFWRKSHIETWLGLL